MSDGKPYAARVRAARAYADLSQSELADKIGVSAQSVKRWEDPTHTQFPKRHHLLAIATVACVPIDFLDHGFGEIAPGTIASSLERLEAALGVDAFERLRDFMRGEISTPRRDAPDDAAPEL